MLFADDIVLCDETKEGLERKLERWREELEMRGLKISRTKTEYMCCNPRNQVDDIHLQGKIVKRTEKFKYLGSFVEETSELQVEVNSRIQAGWSNWKRVSGVLCDRRINVRLKGKVHKTVVRPAMTYGAETWPMKKTYERKMDVVEMRMLRWMTGITRLDRIRNDLVRGTTKVTEVSKKIQEKRLNWFGHVMRRNQEYVGRRMLEMDIPGRRRRGRPKRRWMECITADMEEKDLTVEDVEDRGHWKRLSRNSDPA